MGKRKINMERILDKQKRHVTFSKRRKGLFKKAEDLCTLTGATIAIICFSEAGNPFTFSYPPPAEGQDGDDGRQRLLSVMQQFYARSDGSTTETNEFKPAVVGKSESIREDKNRAMGHEVQQSESNKEMISTSRPLHARGVNASNPDPGSYEFWPASSWDEENEQEVVQLSQLQDVQEAEVALLDSVLGRSVEQNLVESSSCDSLDYSWLSPMPSPSTSFGCFNGSLDFFDMDAEEGAIMLSPLFLF